ncbi:PREDICTED: uncharacterized protein LOC104801461 isoform X2 [Tarenaya hassleriana]|uniref:uncharacterized protein LOC104801461 isoform X2 n=1 Tax=Tarenaya hassleriana TaxID=28532 RepID=UPI00053C8CF6|nr:PREDICTED: uncharacterized protein LOC104801461 isoform X2 [Tarenaya hassleriana]
MAIAEEDAKLELFLDWLQVNGVELRGCNIKYSEPRKGFGIFASSETSDGSLLVVPLDLAITPMRVLQDPLLGPECQKMFEEGEVDDRFLMILFLMVERLRKNSSWKPYLDMLPTRFGNPLWFTDDEMSELKGTNLYRATELQKKMLMSLYNEKVEGLVKRLLILDGGSESEVCFDSFLWANSVFWSRALNIPLPHSYVFPQSRQDPGSCSSISCVPATESANVKAEKESQVEESITHGETVWVEGLVPGIDFCNHDLKPVATWEVDGTGSVSGVPFSMYLLSVEQHPTLNKEITISYGNKGNEELLYLYGFVIENNPDDYLMVGFIFRHHLSLLAILSKKMHINFIIRCNNIACIQVHYPVEALKSIPFSDSKGQLLEAQKAQLRCLLPKSLLDHGFFPKVTSKLRETDVSKREQPCNFSWSGKRQTPTYLNKLVFPEDFMAALRTISMQEDEIFKVSAMLEELVESRPDEQASENEVRVAVWEGCGDSGALQLLVDLLNAKMMDLEENSGSEELLDKACVSDSPKEQTGSRYASFSRLMCRW